MSNTTITTKIRGVPITVEDNTVTLEVSSTDTKNSEVILHTDYDDVYHLPFEANDDKPRPLCRPIEHKRKARVPANPVSESDRTICSHCKRRINDEIEEVTL